MLHYSPEALAAKQKESLDNVLKAAGGSPAYLAKMLGLPLSTVQGWIKRGRISKKGAELVSKNKVLKEHFKPNDIRPDL